MTSNVSGAKPSRLRWAGAAAVVVLAAGGWFGWRAYSNAGAGPEYRTAKVVRGAITATVSATGTLNPVVSVQVGSQVSGQLKEVLADFNAEVKKGQLIAYRVRQAQADLDAASAQVLTAQANVAAARAGVSRSEVNAAEARRDYERKQMLVERNFISTADRDKALATFNAATEDVKTANAQLAVTQAQANSAAATVKQREAVLVQAKIDLERTGIRAPVDGIVIKRSVDAGQTVAASLQSPELFVIAQNLQNMQVDTSIDEAEIGKIKLGQRATFTVDSFPGRSFAGEVLQVRKAATNVQNVVTYVVVVSAQNPDLSLVPGMTANVRIVTDTRESVLKVPNAALRFRPANFQENPNPAPGAQAAPPALARAGAWLATWLPAAHAQGASPLDRFRDRLVAELALSDAQVRQLDGIVASMREKFGALRDLPEGERAAALERTRAEMRDRIEKILTAEQKPKYAAIVAQIAARQAQGGTAGDAGKGAAGPEKKGAAGNAAGAAAGKPADAGKTAGAANAVGSPAVGAAAAAGAAAATSPSASAAAPAADKSGAARSATPAGQSAGGPGGALRQFRERLERELSLTDDQRTQLDAIFGGMREKFASVREAPEGERAKLAERARAELRERIADILAGAEEALRRAGRRARGAAEHARARLRPRHRRQAARRPGAHRPHRRLVHRSRRRRAQGGRPRHHRHPDRVQGRTEVQRPEAAVLTAARPRRDEAR